MKTTASYRTTGIGSLPHHNVDSALEYAFRMGIPFLPQIPIRNPWEFMIAQALEGLPGLQVEKDGQVILNLDIWKSQSHRLERRLDEFFSKEGSSQNRDLFEPSSATSSCWQPFLWELQERGISVGKVQIAGPMTCQWGISLKGGLSPDHYPELGSQIFKLVLARALAMVQRMKSHDIQPILFLDEPGFYALSVSQPKHLLALQELKIVVQTLQKAGARVGIHCCSNTDWEAVLSLGLDILSLDTGISLAPALACKEGKSIENFIHAGGQLSLGVVPTGRSSVLRTLDARSLADQLLRNFSAAWGTESEWTRKILQNAIYTPACGLAFQSTSDAEWILEKLVEVYEHISSH